MTSIQLTQKGQLKHFLSIGDLNKQTLENIMDTAQKLLVQSNKNKTRSLPLLRGKTVINLFFENSTRTRTTFELAAKKLSATVVTLDMQRSSTSKGESLTDTIKTIQAMGADIFVVRHHDSGAASFLARSVSAGTGIINAGDGKHAHPTQAMLDMLTIRTHKKHIDSLSVAIVGDIANSRVARSDIQALKILGVRDIRLIAPPTMLPNPADAFATTCHTSLKEGLQDVDVIIMLRIQKERIQQDALLANEEAFFAQYGLTQQTLAYAKPDALVMHPGPMNRNVEISSTVADSNQSAILQQVHFGVAIRMSIFALVASGLEERGLEEQ